MKNGRLDLHAGGYGPDCYSSVGDPVNKRDRLGLVAVETTCETTFGQKELEAPFRVWFLPWRHRHHSVTLGWNCALSSECSPQTLRRSAQKWRLVILEVGTHKHRFICTLSRNHETSLIRLVTRWATSLRKSRDTVPICPEMSGWTERLCLKLRHMLD